eukprot:1441718-Rhodomonas_salina.3
MAFGPPGKRAKGTLLPGRDDVRSARDQRRDLAARDATSVPGIASRARRRTAECLPGEKCCSNPPGSSSASVSTGHGIASCVEPLWQYLEIPNGVALAYLVAACHVSVPDTLFRTARRECIAEAACMLHASVGQHAAIASLNPFQNQTASSECMHEEKHTTSNSAPSVCNAGGLRLRYARCQTAVLSEANCGEKAQKRQERSNGRKMDE